MKLIWLSQLAQQTNRNKTAIITFDRSYTYGDLEQAIARMISALVAMGVRPGQRLVVIVEHDENALFFMAAASAIGIQILMPYNLQEAALAEWVNIIESAKPDYLIYLKRDEELLANLRTSCSDVITLAELEVSQSQSYQLEVVVSTPVPVNNFLVLFTSGTTGKPKAISISENLICKRVTSVSTRLKFDHNARILMTGLMNNTTGVIFSFGSLLHGSTLIFPDGRNVDTWPAQVLKWKITHMMLRPISMKRFIESARKNGYCLDSMRVLAYGASALPRKTLEEGRAMMRCEWVQGYGLSETYGPFCWLTEEDHQAGLYKKYVYCIGKPDDTLEVSLHFKDGETTTVGEVVLRGAALMQGYYDIATHRSQPVGEWLHTGDYAEFTENGELVLKGRMSNTLLTENGHRIYPEEVESIIGEIPGVDGVILVNLPTMSNLGNSPIACIYGSLADRESNYISALVSKQLRGTLSQEKWPEYIYARKKPFPKNENDKVINSDVVKLINTEALIKLTYTEQF